MFINHNQLFRTRENKNKNIMISLSVRLTGGFNKIKILKLLFYFFNRIYFYIYQNALLFKF